MVALTAPTSAALDVTTPVMGHAKACPTELPRPEMPEIGSPVALVNVTAEGVPRLGVVKVGEVARTMPPEPVTLAPSAVATPVPRLVTPVPPLAGGNTPVTPVVRGKPVTFVIVPDAGVPSAGVTSAGDVERTTEPVPVLVVTPVPPLPTGNVPVTPEVRGRPVAFVRMAAEGVPSAGVTSVGDVLSTGKPLPVAVENPVPPLAMVSGFCRVRLLNVGDG